MRLAVWLAMLALPIAACAAPSRYMGVNLVAAPQSVEQAEVQALARRAQQGDRRAAFDLADRIERGDGVSPNSVQAGLLYAKVATSGSGRWIARNPGLAPIVIDNPGRDDLARAAAARLDRLGSSAPSLTWITVKGVFDQSPGDDDVVADRACEAIMGEFAPLIEPRPRFGCIAQAYRLRGSNQVYSVIEYVDESSNLIRDNGFTGAKLELHPAPNSGECNVYNAVRLAKGNTLVAIVLVSEKLPRDEYCHSTTTIYNHNIKP
jgi:hypothetical protein